MTKGKKTGVKGFTYEFSSSGNPTVFSADVKENANVWFRRYNNSAAFDASEQEFGSAASFAGSDAPTISPSHAGSDTQTGELFSVAQVPDGTQKDSFSTPINDAKSVTFDGTDYWVTDNSFNGSGKIYKFDDTGTTLNTIDRGGNDILGCAWDGSYVWVGNGAGWAYQIDPSNGTEVTSFQVVPKPWGLSWDGSYLWVLSNGPDVVYKTKTDGTRVSNVAVPAGDETVGFTQDGVYLYSYHNNSSTIYRFKEDGSQVDSFAAQSGNTRDMGWKGDYLLECNNGNNFIYYTTGSNSLDISYRFHEVT